MQLERVDNINIKNRMCCLNEFTNKKCSIIGCNGFIGSHLKYYLSRLGIEAFGYDIDSNNKDCLFTNILDRTSIKSINFDVDYVFLLSGLTGTHIGFDRYKEFIELNEEGLCNILDVIRKSDYRPKVIFPSTRLVYKGIDKALKETDEKETKTIYAVNKLACEGYLKAYHDSYDIPYTVFRICIPYGNLLSSDYSFGTIGFFVNQAKSGKDITLYGGGNIKRTFTHMEDLCYQIIEASFHSKSDGQIYNVGGETLSLREAAEIIANKFGTNVVDVPWPERDLKIESSHTYFDDTKIQTLLGGIIYKRLIDFSKDI